MRVLLLSASGYIGLEAVKFPVEVEARRINSSFRISCDELERIGADMEAFIVDLHYFWTEANVTVIYEGVHTA